MKQFIFCVLLLTFSNASHGQDFDSDFRICDGLPASQRAFAIALGNGDLKNAAVTTLKSLSEKDLEAAIRSLFHPAPSSLVQLNGRVDDFVHSVQLAAQLQMQFNQIVASKISTASNDNIVCSMSLLSYREASDIFGKRIATQYGVVQVTMRNTDSNHEFLLHQVDFWFGDTLQYYATRDKKLARGVAEKGQAIDPRNVTVRVLEGIGMVAGPATNAFSNDAMLGSSIYNSSFIPAVKYVFPDLTVQQIAKLDDMGFSAGASTMLIPKNGAISFVAFIPTDSFLIPKLAQYENLLDPNSENGKVLDDCSKLQSKQMAVAAKSAEENNETKTTMTSDEVAALERCDKMLAPKEQPAVPSLSVQTVRNSKGKSQETGVSTIVTLGLHKKKKSVASFDAAAVLLLQKDLHILASGSHIQQLTTQLAINSASCSMPDPLVSDSVVTCALTGNNLASLTQGWLISQSDSTISVPSNGLKAGKDDPAHAELSFSGCAFVNKPQGNYQLEISSSNTGAQIVPSLQVLKPNAFVCKGGGAAITCQLPSGASATSVTLTGNDKTAHNFAPAGTTVNAGTLASGTYQVDAVTGGKTVHWCPVTF